VFGENIIKLLHRFVYYFVHSEGDVHLHDEFLVPGEPTGSLPAVLLNGGPQTLEISYRRRRNVLTLESGAASSRLMMVLQFGEEGVMDLPDRQREALVGRTDGRSVRL